jgi:hypothetical protein
MEEQLKGINWISVTQKLPDDGKLVLAWSYIWGCDEYMIMEYSAKDESWHDERGLTMEVMYWAELIPPVKYD